MKKILIGLFAVLTAAFSSAFAESKTIRIGASEVPHAEILRFIRPALEKKGYKLKIVVFNDYVAPNLSLKSGELDANFFQHVPYLERFTKDRGIKDLVSIGGVFVEPITLYSKKYKKKSDITAGKTIAIPNDPSNEARVLILLHDEGFIKLKDKTNLKSTVNDIADKKGLKFKEIDAAQLPRVLGEVDFAFINGNYAIPAGLSSKKDGVLVEGSKSPYANVVVVKEKDKNAAWAKDLISALRTPEVRKFILDKYKGQTVPVF